ncbi:MAG: hypothetical protein KAY37_06130 [Phycisphaerae bacterium]|nr:hypothetical protein [Phycisphaerae bacterium]
MSYIRCPACQARYQVPVTASGKRTKCKKCGRSFKIPVLKQAETPPLEPLQLVELDALSTGEAIETERPDPPPQPALPAAQPPAAILPSDAVAYAPGETAEEETQVRGAYGRYFRSLALTLVFPIKIGNLITYFIVLAMLVVGWIASCAPLFGLIAGFIITGWYMSFQLNVVLSAAGGEEELPTLSLTGGWYDDIVVPFFKMLAATAAARLPATIYLMTASTLQSFGGGFSVFKGIGFLFFGSYNLLLDQPDLQTQVIGGALLLAGYFLLPMFILVAAVAGAGGLFRLDLIAATVAKSLPAYLITVLILCVSKAVEFVLALVAIGLGVGVFIAGWDVSLLVLLRLAFFTVELYVIIITMRTIGFYYHHFKHKFAWSWG